MTRDGNASAARDNGLARVANPNFNRRNRIELSHSKSLRCPASVLLVYGQPMKRWLALHLLIVLFHFAGGGCSAFSVLNATVPACNYARTADLAYGSQPRQMLDVYRPVGRKPDGRVVIFFYGGDWQAGTKENYRFVAASLAGEGFVAVLPDYRLHPAVNFPAFVEDGAHAVRWVHDNISKFGGDPTHIYLMGHSAGAHIAVLLTLDGRYLKNAGLDRSVVCGTAGLSGVYDFVPAPDDRGVFGMARDETHPPPDIEPVNFVDGQAPPMLLAQGLKDDVVGPTQSIQLATKIWQKQGQARYIAYPTRGHRGVCLALAWDFTWLAPVLKDCTEFFRSH